MASEYFELGTLPAYGASTRATCAAFHDDVRFEVEKPDLRPAMVFDHVQDAIINGFRAQGNKDAESLLRFTDCRDVLISAARVLTPVPVFLGLEGANEGVKIDGGDLTKAAKSLAKR